MYLKKDKAGSAPGHTWDEDGQVLWVEDELATELLNIPQGGFSEASAPEPKEQTPKESPEDKEPTPKLRRPRDDKGRLVRDENGKLAKKTEIAE
jgi:hypothetical protein